MKKLTLTKENIKIELENTDDKKIVIRYEFVANAEADKDSLSDYVYLLDKILIYMKSGEYQVVEEKESS